MALAALAPGKLILAVSLYIHFVCPDFRVIVCPLTLIFIWVQGMSLIFSSFSLFVVVRMGVLIFHVGDETASL